MANDNIKRYLDYDGLVYLINKFNSVIEANEYTTSEALNDLNRKIAELNINDNTGGFPIIDADITQVDSVYTTTENLNELITPGQYIVDSSKIQYEEDNFVKTLYWLLSVDKVVYDNSESIIQTYYPLSYLSYNWYNIPIGGLLQRFYEGNNTWTDLQVAAPGDVDPSKFVTKNEFDNNINTINTSINTINTSINNINTSITNVNEEIADINETIEGLNKTDNDTKCTSATINVSDAPVVSENEVDVIAKQTIRLSSETGESLSGDATSVKVVTKKYVEENYIPKSESDSIWEAINSGRVDNISLEKSFITKAIADEEVNVPYINNKISFTEFPTGSFVGKFDVISLPTKNYVINNYVDKSSYIPNILKNGTPQAGDEKDFSLQWYQTSDAITDTNSTDYHDICAPSYSDFNETSASLNKNSMIIRGFWTPSYFHDIWMSPNSDYILHRNIDNGTAKPWKILLDNENCGDYVKNIIDTAYVKNIIDTEYIKSIIENNTTESVNTKQIIIPKILDNTNAIIGNNLFILDTALDSKVREYSNITDKTDLSILFTNKPSSLDSLSIGYYDSTSEKNCRIASFYTYTYTGRAQGRFDLDGELCVHTNDYSYLLFEHDTTNASANDNPPRQGYSSGTFTVKSYEQNYITDNFYIRRNNLNNIFNNPDSYDNLVYIHSGSASFSIPVYFNNDINLNNSKHIYFGSVYNSKNLPDFGDIIYSGNIKINNKDKYHELGRIWTDYSSNNYLSFKIRRTEGLDKNNVPILKDYTLIDSGNILSNLPSTVITTNNISNYSAKSSEYIKIDSVNNISEYTDCLYFIAGNSTNINEGSGPEPNKIYQPKFIPLNDFINGTASGNPAAAFVSDTRWTSTLRLFFNQKYFYDVQFDPNNQNIIHRLVCNGTANDWHLLLDSNNYNDFFKISHLTPKSLTVTNNINVGGGVYETSDETLKDFQDSIQVNFEQLKEIPKAYFTFKDDKTGETKIGTSAQKVKEFYPELVSEDENGILSVDYAKLSMVALKAVDELDNRISKLEKLVVQLLENK